MAAMPHESQVLRSHMAWNLAGPGKLSDRIVALKNHLQNPQAVRMSQGPQVFGSLLEGS
jgi:hypothetical protein